MPPLHGEVFFCFLALLKFNCNFAFVSVCTSLISPNFPLAEPFQWFKRTSACPVAHRIRRRLIHLLFRFHTCPSRGRFFALDDYSNSTVISLSYRVAPSLTAPKSAFAERIQRVKLPLASLVSSMRHRRFLIIFLPFINTFNREFFYFFLV